MPPAAQAPPGPPEAPSSAAETPTELTSNSPITPNFFRKLTITLNPPLAKSHFFARSFSFLLNLNPKP
jgi:hypothetical protein